MSFREARDVVVRTRLREDFATDLDFDPHEVFVLQLDEHLPDVCTRHGEPAVEHTDKSYEFRPRNPRWFSKGFRWVQRTIGSDARFVLTTVIRRATWRKGPLRPATTRLEGTWPLCARCLRAKKIRQYLGHAVMLAGPALLLALVIVCHLTTSKSIRGPVVAAFFPGWVCVGLNAAVLLYVHSTTFVRFRPITDNLEVRVRAHRNFLDAYESRASSAARPQLPTEL